MENPRILFIAQTFPRQKGPESYVNGKLAIAFRRKGWHIDILTEAPHADEDDSLLWNTLARSTYIVKQNGLPNIFILRQTFWLIKAFFLALRLHKKNKYNLILSRAQPIWSHVLAYAISNKTGIKWVANWNDPVPIRRYPPPYGAGPDAPLSVLSSYMFNKICLKADWHTFPCERLKNYMLSYMPAGTAKKSSVIAHIFIEDIAQNSSCLAKQHEKLKLCHSGSTYYRNWQQFLLAFKMFAEKEHVNDVQVIFIGWQPDDFRQAVIKYKLTDHIIIEPPVSYEKSFSFLIDANILLLIEADCNEGIFMPSKIADYAGSKKPLLAVSPKIGTLADLISLYDSGIAVDCTSPEEIAKALDAIYAYWKRDTLGQEYNTTKLIDMFSEKKIIAQYEEIFTRVINKKAL